MVKLTAEFSIQPCLGSRDGFRVDLIDSGSVPKQTIRFMQCGLEVMVTLALSQHKKEVPKRIRFHMETPEHCSKYEVEVAEWQESDFLRGSR